MLSEVENLFIEVRMKNHVLYSEIQDLVYLSLVSKQVEVSSVNLLSEEDIVL
jgi:hypothetical protein